MVTLWFAMYWCSGGVLWWVKAAKRVVVRSSISNVFPLTLPATSPAPRRFSASNHTRSRQSCCTQTITTTNKPRTSFDQPFIVSMVSSNSILSSVLVGSAVGLSSTSSFVGAFQSQPQRHATPTTPPPPTTTVFSSSDDDGVSSSLDISRRSALQKSAAVAVSSLCGAAVVGGAVQPAEASYSAYLHREEDWANRAKSGGELVLC